MADFTRRRVTMVDTQVRPSDVTRFSVLDAMLSVPREAFVPDGAQDVAYMGGAIPLSDDRQLLEARTIGKMLQALNITGSDLVLEIGPGLGYTTALLSRLAEAVVAVEVDEAMASEAEANLAAESVDNAAVMTGPLEAGYAAQGPYDVIVLFGGVTEIPSALTDQLNEGGRIMAIFMDGPLGEVRMGHKRAGSISWRMEFNATAPVLPGFAAAPAFHF